MAENEAQHFDLIIAGLGIAGYSLLYEAMQQGIWTDKKILAIDSSFTGKSNKMISFWDRKDSRFRAYCAASWEKLSFYSHSGKKTDLVLGDYAYFTIDSHHLLSEYHQYLVQCPNIVFMEAKINDCQSGNGGCKVLTDKGDFTSAYVFNSIFYKPPIPEKYQYFLQHFKGVLIKPEAPYTAYKEATIMDYRTDQKHGTTFFYCLPMSADAVFVEYTLFSKTLLPDTAYMEAIRQYLSEVLRIDKYQIVSEEQGVIPMTDYPFQRRKGNIIYLGTAGGDTRGSTGYTFYNVQQTVQAIIKAFRDTGTPFFKQEHIGAKDKLYDATLLAVLNEGHYPGHEIFTDLFEGTAAKNVFQFLDADSSLLNDIKIMKSLRTIPFAKHFIKTLFRA